MSLFTSQVSGHLFALAPLPLFFQLMLRPRPLPLFVLSLRCGLFRAPQAVLDDGPVLGAGAPDEANEQERAGQGRQAHGGRGPGARRA